MAKKQAAKKASKPADDLEISEWDSTPPVKKSPVKKKPSRQQMPKKTAFQVRLDADTQTRIRVFCDEMGISMNQWIEGVLGWAIDNSIQGEPLVHGEGRVVRRDRFKCCFFGRTTHYSELPDEADPFLYRDWEPKVLKPGHVIFMIDHSERGYVPWRGEGSK